MQDIQLVVFDMAGTTVKDQGEVSRCFMEAAAETGLQADLPRIKAMMGWSKIKVFETLWYEQMRGSDYEVRGKIWDSYESFRNKLEDFYQHETVEPTEGCLEAFAALRAAGIKIGLSTGFYKKVTDIILDRLGWQPSLPQSPIDANISSDQVSEGRPAPLMIQKLMKACGVRDAARVIKIGDTPVDIGAGRQAGCGLSLGVGNGTHSAEELKKLDCDGVLGSLRELPAFLGLPQVQV
jgi:phosphonatase-like hydrolase